MFVDDESVVRGMEPLQFRVRRLASQSNEGTERTSQSHKLLDDLPQILKLKPVATPTPHPQANHLQETTNKTKSQVLPETTDAQSSGAGLPKKKRKTRVGC